MPTSVKRLADFSNSQDPKRLQLPPMLALQSTKTRVAISDDPRILLAMLSIQCAQTHPMKGFFTILKV